MPSLVVADESGQIYDHHQLKLAAKSGYQFIQPESEHLIPLPFGSQLFTMPERVPMGWDEKKQNFVPCSSFVINGKKRRCFPVAAFLAPGYIRTLLPATQNTSALQTTLPLWAYCAVGWKDEKFWVTGLQIDPNPHWHPKFFQDDKQMASAVHTMLQEKPNNRLFKQLGRCALEYHCFAAKNLFLKRWECPLPTSPVCNSRCLGCLSLQPAGDCPSSQERITFVPSVDELVEVALPHLSVEDSIVSFGQGCEGEPLLQADTLARTIRQLRKQTRQGIINLNTNGSLPHQAEELYKAGLDSIRVSLNSLDPTFYNRYYRPVGYNFNDVLETLKRAKAYKVFTAINLLIFPGITDRQKECEKLLQFIEKIGIDLIQMRNLNIDPDLYMDKMKTQEENLGEFMPIWKVVEDLRSTFPKLKLGYFNQPAKVIGGNR
ncbi:MAG: radical SAM protein [Deltaproteobacteria bacterium]|nr:radical SAM protein [Deltaproteobacteria bacterium]